MGGNWVTEHDSAYGHYHLIIVLRPRRDYVSQLTIGLYSSVD